MTDRIRLDGRLAVVTGAAGEASYGSGASCTVDGGRTAA